MIENKVIVMLRLDDGDDKKVSIKAVDRNLSNEDKLELIERINHVLKPDDSNKLYYTIRATIRNKKYNWKEKTLNSVLERLEEVFSI